MGAPLRIMAATQDLSGEWEQPWQMGHHALQVLTRSTICNVLGTIKPNVSFPGAPLFCVGQSRGGWASVQRQQGHRT